MRARTWTLAVSAVTLACLAVPAVAQTRAAPGKPAAVVNGEAIDLAEVDMILKRQPPPAQPLTAEQKRQQRLEILEMLIVDLLIQQYLQKSGIKADPSEVKKELAKLEASLKSQGRT